MGKYSDKKLRGEQDTYEGRDLQLKIWIANELAEANRLERLRLLRLKIPYQDDKISGWEKELKDQA